MPPGAARRPLVLALGLTLGAWVASGVAAGEDAPGRPLAPLSVFDAANQLLGPVLVPAPPSAWVLVEGGGRAAAVRVTRDGVVTGTAFAVFELPGCAGPPLLFAPPLPPPLAAFGRGVPLAGVGPGNELHVEAGPASMKPIQSAYVPTSVPPCLALGGNLSVLPSTPLRDLGGLVPPLALEPPAAAGRQALPVPSLLDAGGQLIGDVVGSLFDGVILTVRVGDAGGVWLAVAGANRFAGGTSLVVFAAANCTGPPVVPTESVATTPLFPLTGIGPDGVLYRGGAPVSPFVPGSVWNSFEDPPGCRSPLLASTHFGEAVPVVDLGAFTAPFRVGLAPASPAGGPLAGRRPRRPLVLTDQLGRTLGPLYVEGGDDGLAVLRAGGQAAAVHVTRERFLQGTSVAYFEDAGCAGPVLIEEQSADGPDRLFPLTAVGPGNVLHVQSGQPAASRLVSSRFDPSGPQCTPLAPAQTRDVIPGGSTLDLTAFPGPFAGD